MEIRDLYDERRNLTGKKVQVGDKIPEGFYYTTVVVLIENSKGEILLQKRSIEKGNDWALTGGHPKTGETSKEGMICEIKEELGIDVLPVELFLVKTVKTIDGFFDLYYMKKDIDLKNIKLQLEEVQEVSWFTKSEVDELIKEGKFHSHHDKMYYDILKEVNKEHKLNDLGTVTLETDRLILRKIRLDDYHDMYENWAKDPDVAKYVTWNPHKNEEDTKSLIEMWLNDYNSPFTYNWFVEIKDTHELIGNISVVDMSKSSLRASIGYCYGKKYWNKGYAKEALKAVIKFLTEEVMFEQVNADYLMSNPNSGKVMAACGMKFVGILPRWHINKDGIREDLGLYTYIKSENELYKN